MNAVMPIWVAAIIVGGLTWISISCLWAFMESERKGKLKDEIIKIAIKRLGDKDTSNAAAYAKHILEQSLTNEND